MRIMFEKLPNGDFGKDELTSNRAVLTRFVGSLALDCVIESDSVNIEYEKEAPLVVVDTAPSTLTREEAPQVAVESRQETAELADVIDIVEYRQERISEVVESTQLDTANEDLVAEVNHKNADLTPVRLTKTEAFIEQEVIADELKHLIPLVRQEAFSIPDMSVDIEEEVAHSELPQLINRLFSKAQLTDKERYVLEKRFPLSESDQVTPSTLEELGQEMGISRERVRQLENRAFRRMEELAGSRDLFSGYVSPNYLGDHDPRSRKSERKWQD